MVNYHETCILFFFVFWRQVQNYVTCMYHYQPAESVRVTSPVRALDLRTQAQCDLSVIARRHSHPAGGCRVVVRTGTGSALSHSRRAKRHWVKR